MKPTLKLCAASAAALLLTGCTLDYDMPEENSFSYYEETAAETTEAVFPDLTDPARSPSYDDYDDTYRDTEPLYTEPDPQETELPPETTAAVTETASETETTAGTDTTALPAETAESETQTSTAPAHTGPAQHQLSGIAAVRLPLSKDPAQYCREEEGQTVFDLAQTAGAAGFRADGSTWRVSANGAEASLEPGALLSADAYGAPADGSAVLRQIRYSFGGRQVIVDQQSPRKVSARLTDGTAVTPDQIALFCYLAEQLAADPASDPLAAVIPSYFREELGGTVYYYIP